MASFLKTLTRSSSSSTPRFLPRQTNPLKFKNLIFLPPKSMASWSCSQCTFLNSPSQKSTCQICQSTQPHTLTDPPSSSSPSKPKWSCKACTFLNSYRNNNCEICGTRASSASLLSTLKTCDDDELDSSVGSVFLPLKACSKKKITEAPAEILDGDDVDTGGFHGIKRKNREIPAELLDDAVGSGPSGGVRKSANKSVAVLDETQPSKDLKMLKILSYNVWFREDLEMHKRMKALGDLIQLHSPDLICLQEVTPNIYDIFQQSGWWKLYKCSISNEMAFTRPYFCMQLSKLPVKSFCCKPFRNSMMGRELCVADVAFEEDTPLVIATSHLESPCLGPPTWDQTFSKERVDQAKEAFDFLKTNTNVIFCGDMNWDDKSDGKVPLPEGWIDAWTELRPGEIGWTYDTKSNMMLSGNRTLQKRLDRFLCCLRDFKIDRIEMIGWKQYQVYHIVKRRK